MRHCCVVLESLALCSTSYRVTTGLSFIFPWILLPQCWVKHVSCGSTLILVVIFMVRISRSEEQRLFCWSTFCWVLVLPASPGCAFYSSLTCSTLFENDVWMWFRRMVSVLIIDLQSHSTRLRWATAWMHSGKCHCIWTCLPLFL